MPGSAGAGQLLCLPVSPSRQPQDCNYRSLRKTETKILATRRARLMPSHTSGVQDKMSSGARLSRRRAAAMPDRKQLAASRKVEKKGVCARLKMEEAAMRRSKTDASTYRRCAGQDLLRRQAQ